MGKQEDKDAETSPKAVPATAAAVVIDPRLDEYSYSMIKYLGFVDPIPKGLVDVFLRVKTQKDKIFPGRLSPEGFAFVAVLHDMIEGKIKE
jgi:hypothetical protein